MFNEERWGKEEKKKEGVEGGGAIHCIVYKVYCFTFFVSNNGIFFVVVALFAEGESLCLSFLSQAIHTAPPAALLFVLSPTH